MKLRAIPSLAAAVLGTWLAPAPRAEAAYIATMQEVGADVVVTGSGTINLGGLTLFIAGGQTPGGIFPGRATTALGPSGNVAIDWYTGTFTGPGNFGSGGTVFSDSGSGDRTTIAPIPADSVLYVPAGYVSGGQLAGTASFLNQSFASLGVIPGSYVWSWGEGQTADSFTLNIIGTVPEPGTLALLGAGLVGLAAARRRKAG